MAMRHLIGTSAAFLLIVAAGFTNAANAQNYEGSGKLRFGAFLQGALIDGEGTQTLTTGATAIGNGGYDTLGLGLSFGYDQRFGSIVLGIESDVAVDDGAANYPPAEFNTDYYATLRGRLGVLASPNWMLYATAGLSMAAAEFKGEPTTVTRLDKEHSNLFGYTVGGGIEYDYGPMALFAEYLYTDYEKWTVTSQSTGTQFSVDADGSLIRAGVKFVIGNDYTHDTYAPLPPLK